MLDEVLSRFVARLQSIYTLLPEESFAINQLPTSVRALGANQLVAAYGDSPTQCCLVLDGLLARTKMFERGQRQITAFHLPGDIPDIFGLHLSVMDHDLTSLVPSKVALIQHSAIRSLIQNFPSVGAALWKQSMIEASIGREWTARTRRNARQRLAHLSCELLARMAAIGLLENDTLSLPLTQTVLSDALGISSIHVNRVIQELRSEGLILWRYKQLQVLDLARFKMVAEFDPIYLHLLDRKINN